MENIQTEGRTFDEVERDVVDACAAEGILLSTEKSQKTPDNSRYVMKKLACQRGGTNRQESYLKRQDSGKRFLQGTSTGLYVGQRALAR